MVLPESLNRLLRSGIDPALSAEQTRHIMAVNTGAMLGVAATLPFVGLGVWLDNPLMSVLNLMHLVLWLPSVALNRWGWHRLAATTLLGTATLEFAIQPLLWGIESGAQYALMIPAFVAWSMYDRHNTRWAAAMSGLATLLFLIHLNLQPEIKVWLDATWPETSRHYGPVVWPRAGVDAHVIFAANVCTTALFVTALSYALRLQILNVDRRLQSAREQSETLLLNVFPQTIVPRLKGNERIADQYSEVTVLFADLVGFTPFSSQRTVDEVLAVLERLFSCYDDLAASHGVEKVKTIGDAYMAVAGAPVPCQDHAERVARLALEMREATRKIAQELGVDLRLRIGMHSGPAVAGVIGQQRFSWDIWGDTVNVAARMESHGEPDQIQVSEATRAHLDHPFECKPRGAITVKGKGQMETFWLVQVEDLTPEEPR